MRAGGTEKGGGKTCAKIRGAGRRGAPRCLRHGDQHRCPSATVAGKVKLSWGTSVGSLLPPAMTDGIKVILITGKKDYGPLKYMKDGAKAGPKRPRQGDGRGPSQFPTGGSYRRGSVGR